MVKMNQAYRDETLGISFLGSTPANDKRMVVGELEAVKTLLLIKDTKYVGNKLEYVTDIGGYILRDDDLGNLLSTFLYFRSGELQLSDEWFKSRKLSRRYSRGYF
jgi:hypothetical protein